MTPTTAPVIAVSGAVNFRSLCVVSIRGPPVNMKKAIRNIQLILAKNGYDAGAPDGVMGGKTTKAIAAYQAANGMKSTGEVDEALVRSLLAKAK